MRWLPTLLLFAACATTQETAAPSTVPTQTLTSPCVTPGEADPGKCPACTTDADCMISSNPCQKTAACVPTAGKWMVTLEGCAHQNQLPAASSCGCTAGVCQAK